MHRSILILIFTYSVAISSIGQNASDKILGKWIISKFQPCQTYGMTYSVAQMYVGDTVTIDSIIRQSFEENEYTKAMGMSQVICEYHPVKTEKIKDIARYFEEHYNLKPILLSLNSQKDVYVISTDCSDLLYNELIYNKTDDVLFVNQDGMFFILKRLK